MTVSVTAARAPVLRWYQRQYKADAYAAWDLLGPKSNLLVVSATGSGKTVFLADIVREHEGHCCVIAHRQELVAQISMALARCGVMHRIIGPATVVRAICQAHLEKLGRCWFDPNARASVAGVDTLVRRLEDLGEWRRQVTLWVCDEAHHPVANGTGGKPNKWAAAAAAFPNAKGLGVTATPCRADGKGLGRHSDGIFDLMISGPTMRDLINQGFLTDYRIVCAPTHIELAKASINSHGDYTLDRGAGKKAVRESSLIGDVVATYRKWAPGKLAVCFATDLETAADFVAKFNAEGIPAAQIDGSTPDDERRQILRKFERREYLVLLSCELISEGFDLPAIEVVLMARPTLSFGLFAQQFGRALRLMVPSELMPVWDALTDEQRRAHIAASSKPAALIIDHVGNVVAHGLPDSRNDWTLDAADRRSKGGPSDAEPLAYCRNPECAQVYPRAKPCCPYCGHKIEPGPGGRGNIKAVDGDLAELDPATLAAMRGETAQALRSLEQFRNDLSAKGTPHMHVLAHAKLHAARLDAARNLRDAMAWWAGEKRAAGQSDSEIYRRFYLTFGVDWESAQALPRAGLTDLAARVDEKLTAPSLSARVRPTN